MKKGLTVVFVLVAFAVSGISTIAAQEKEMKVTVTAGAGEGAACAHGMKLTDEQKGKLEEMRRECALEREDLRADLMKLRVSLKRAMGAEEPKLAEIEAVVKKMSAVREKMQMGRIECMLEARKILGPDWREHRGCCAGEGPLWIGAGGDDPETFDIMIDTDEDAEAGEMRVMRFRGGEEIAPPAAPEGCGGRKVIMLRSPESGGAPMVWESAGDSPHGYCPMMKGHAESGPCAPAMRWSHVERTGCGAGHGCSSSCASQGKACKMMVVRKPGGHACSCSCGSNAEARYHWETKMYRPHGKRTEHRCSGDCKQMESGCKSAKSGCSKMNP